MSTLISHPVLAGLLFRNKAYLLPTATGSKQSSECLTCLPVLALLVPQSPHAHVSSGHAKDARDFQLYDLGYKIEASD